MLIRLFQQATTYRDQSSSGSSRLAVTQRYLRRTGPSKGWAARGKGRLGPR